MKITQEKKEYTITLPKEYDCVTIEGEYGELEEVCGSIKLYKKPYPDVYKYYYRIRGISDFNGKALYDTLKVGKGRHGYEIVDYSKQFTSEKYRIKTKDYSVIEKYIKDNGFKTIEELKNNS